MEPTTKKSAPKKVTLNRAVFSERAHDSKALSCLDTLLHQFAENGDYVVLVYRGTRMVRQLTVQVRPDNASTQHNIDLSSLEEQNCSCQKTGTSDYALKIGGLLGFYVSTGIASYRITIRNATTKDRAVIFDSSKGIAAGDFFAATLVKPGIYRVRDQIGKADAAIHVAMPPSPSAEAKKVSAKNTESIARISYRPDQPQLLDFGPKGFSQKELQLYAGQSVVVHCTQVAHLRFELEKPDKAASEKPKQRHFEKLKPKPEASDIHRRS